MENKRPKTRDYSEFFYAARGLWAQKIYIDVHFMKVCYPLQLPTKNMLLSYILPAKAISKIVFSSITIHNRF